MGDFPKLCGIDTHKASIYLSIYLSKDGSCCIRGTKKSTLSKDSSVSFMHHDPSDIGSMILITLKERTLRL